MNDLNEQQRIIAESLEGMMVVDAGPGTGKTHTIVQRYRNIMSVPGVDPRDVLLLTFTNNAAAEMRERLEELVGNDAVIQATTFDAFCLDLVLDSAESVSKALGFKESLTRGARLIQSKSVNRDHFRKVFSKFMKEHGHRYKGMSAIAGGAVSDLFDLIEKMMSRGMIPLPGYDWIGEGTALEGDARTLAERLKGIDGRTLITEAVRNLEDDPPEWFSEEMEEVPGSILADAVSEDRRHLIWMVHDIYREYLRSSISDNRLTFGLVELFALAALHGDGSVRKRTSYRYVMVDEFQDTNELQMKITMLILREPNLCAVGDWKQGIYGFRNVSIENITDFEERVESARSDLNRGEKRIGFAAGNVKRHHLKENYRSTQVIIDSAFKALTVKATDKERMKDRSSDIVHINAMRDEIGGHTGFEMLRASGPEKEIHLVAQRAYEYVNDPKYAIWENGESRRPKYSDIAVLCKRNETGRQIRDKMEELGIPVFLQGDAKIMSSREAKLALAWLRYVNNPNDPRGPVAIMADMGYSLAEIESSVSRTKDGMRLPSDLKEMRRGLLPKKRRVTALLTSIFSVYGLNNDVTQAIISVISSAHRESLLTISDVIRLIENDMERSETYELDPSLDRDAVTVQTMHKSKGLEYPMVIIAGVNSGSFPRSDGSRSVFVIDDLFGLRATQEYAEDGGYHRIRQSWRWNLIRNAKDFDYDEQRRLLFVAISRAKQYVTMTCYRPSGFMKGYGESNIIFTEPSLGKVDSRQRSEGAERPSVGTYGKRRSELSVHDLMGETAGGGGKGTEYGTRVHEAAYLLATGRIADEGIEEVPEIRRILESLSGADLLTEVECILPLEEAVIRGVADLIAVFPDRVEVHDYKTDGNMDNLHRYRLQLGIYGYVAEAYFKRRTECFIDFVSMKVTEPVRPMTQEEIDKAVSPHLSGPRI